MNEFEFTLKFALPRPDEDPEEYVDLLEKAGCDDAFIGIGKQGRIALEFIRKAKSAKEAITSAIADVRKAIPNARLIEGDPDLVGLTDIAELGNFTRQNARKVALSDPTFPVPMHEGVTALFHLSDVLRWMKDTRQLHVDPGLLDVAGFIRQVNIATQVQRLPHEKLDAQIEAACRTDTEHSSFV